MVCRMKRKKMKFRLQPKLIMGLVFMAVVLVLALTSVVVVVYRGQMEEQYGKVAFDEATIAAEMIDGDMVEKYYATGEKDAYYEKVAAALLCVKQTIGLKYFYVVVPEEDVMVYIWDVGEEGEEGVRRLLDTDSYYGGGNEVMHAAFSANAKRTILFTRNEEYGYLASAYVPIFNSAGEPVALSSVDISMEKINRDIYRFVWTAVSIAGLAMFVSIIAYYYYIRRIVIRPAEVLHDAASALIKNDMDDLENFSIRVKTGDEFEELADAFQFMTVELSEYIKNLTVVTAERERIGAELDVATQIQSSMLPCIFPAFPDRREFDIYATMNPAKEVGGDFYDFFMVDERHLAIVMADVSGKGVPAALFMVIGKTLIKDHTQPGRDLGEVFTEVNDLLCEANSEGLFITAFEGVLDLVTGEFQFVNAGHEIPFICKSGGFYEPYKIRAGFVLAGMEGIRYKAGTMQLEPGDKIFQYTDGITEAMNSRNELYGMKRLEETLRKNVHKAPMELLPEVKADIDSFVGSAVQFDDITMLCLEYRARMEGIS